MEEESWYLGYLTGAALHRHVRVPQVRPSVIAALSVTGIASDFEWYADLSGVEMITALSAAYVGDVYASYSFDGHAFSNPVRLSELLAVSPSALFYGASRLWFHFRLADSDADLTSFTLWGVYGRTSAYAV